MAKKLIKNMKVTLEAEIKCSYTIKPVNYTMFDISLMCFPLQTQAPDCKGKRLPED